MSNACRQQATEYLQASCSFRLLIKMVHWVLISKTTIEALRNINLDKQAGVISRQRLSPSLGILRILMMSGTRIKLLRLLQKCLKTKSLTSEPFMSGKICMVDFCINLIQRNVANCGKRKQLILHLKELLLNLAHRKFYIVIIIE